jgi:hypothetical protein
MVLSARLHAPDAHPRLLRSQHLDDTDGDPIRSTPSQLVNDSAGNRADVWLHARRMEASLESSPPAFLRASPLRARACELAAARHAGGKRWDGAPFVLHPLEVASILANSGGSDEVVAAGMLHDVLEKTDMVADELRAEIGDHVTALVVAVSEDESISPYAARKQELRERAADAGADALAVLAADKVTKVRELRARLTTGGSIDSDARLRLDHYEDTLATLRMHAPELPVARQLEFELWALQAMPPER